jgi:hypothetical protein
LTRSHHSQPSAIHIANDRHNRSYDGVTYVNVYRRSLLSSRTFRKLAPSTCAARKDSAVHVSLSSSSLVKQPGAEAPTLRAEGLKASTRRRTPTDNYRLGLHSSQWRASKTRQRAEAEGQGVAALSGRVISPPDRACQRLLSTNRRTTPKNRRKRRNPHFSGLRAVLEPQSCDVLVDIRALLRKFFRGFCQFFCAVRSDHLRGMMNPAGFPCDRGARTKASLLYSSGSH